MRAIDADFKRMKKNKVKGIWWIRFLLESKIARPKIPQGSLNFQIQIPCPKTLTFYRYWYGIKQSHVQITGQLEELCLGHGLVRLGCQHGGEGQGAEEGDGKFHRMISFKRDCLVSTNCPHDDKSQRLDADHFSRGCLNVGLNFGFLTGIWAPTDFRQRARRNLIGCFSHCWGTTSSSIEVVKNRFWS